jgi:hypothetical protein
MEEINKNEIKRNVFMLICVLCFFAFCGNYIVGAKNSMESKIDNIEYELDNKANLKDLNNTYYDIMDGIHQLKSGQDSVLIWIKKIQ